MVKFVISKFVGVNQASNPMDLKPYEATDVLNVRVTDEKSSKREGTKVLPITGLKVGVKVTKIKTVRDYLLSFQTGDIFRYDGSTSHVATGLTGLDTSAIPKFVEFKTSDGVDLTTGSISSFVSNGYGINDSAATMTINEYVGKLLIVGTEIRHISANTETEVFTDEPLEDSTATTYSIQTSVDGNYFFNGVDNSKKNTDITGTTWTDLTNIPKFKTVTTYMNRIIGAIDNSDEIHISTLLNGEDFPSRYVFKIWQGGNGIITSVSSFGNQLIIHKSNGGIIISEFIDPANASFVERTQNFSCVSDESIATGENMYFFGSNRGIDIFNPLETNLLEGHDSISSMKLPKLATTDYDKTTSKGITFDAKYYFSVEKSGVREVFIFDMRSYLKSKSQGRTGIYPFLIDSGYEAECFEVYDDKLHMGGTGQIIYFDKTAIDDQGTPISSFWERGGITHKYASRRKAARFIDIIKSGGTTSDYVDFTLSSEKESKSLTQMVFDKESKRVTGKRVIGKVFKLKVDMTGLGQGSIENIDLYSEIGKI